MFDITYVYRCFGHVDSCSAENITDVKARYNGKYTIQEQKIWPNHYVHIQPYSTLFQDCEAMEVMHSN